MLRLKIILGSTRNGRFGIQPAEWIMDLTKQFPDASFELIDLAEHNLPFITESTPPFLISDGNYEKASTQRWSKTIDDADGYVIVTPEYNYSVPAALKNAIDLLSNEWNYKPAAFVSYGASAGGARAVEHLRNISGWLQMYDLREQVIIADYWSQLDENGKFQPTNSQTHGAEAMLKELIFWAEQFKAAREQRAAKSGEAES